MKKRILSILFALVLVLTLGLAVPAAAADPSGTFTVSDGTYETVWVNDENGDISATLTGSWAPSDVLGDFTATGTGSIYGVEAPESGTTVTVEVSGTLAAGQIDFSGTAVQTAGDPITDDLFDGITGTVTITTDGAIDVVLVGQGVGYSVNILMTGVLQLTGTGGSETDGDVPGVTLVTPATGDISTTPTVVITGLGFTGATAVAFSGTGITVTTFTEDSDTQITADLVIAADAPAGLRDVTVTVFDGPLTGTGLYTINESFTLTAPSNISLGLMMPGATASEQSLADGTVVTNVSTWLVDALDEKVLETGYMNTATDGSGTSLAAMFEISDDGTTYADAATGITYIDVNALPFYVSQAVALDDAVGSYSITITFTATY